MTDFADIKQVRHKISLRSQVQSHGGGFRNRTFTEHLLCRGHYFAGFAGADTLLLPRTQGGVFSFTDEERITNLLLLILLQDITNSLTKTS